MAKKHSADVSSSEKAVPFMSGNPEEAVPSTSGNREELPTSPLRLDDDEDSSSLEDIFQ